LAQLANWPKPAHPGTAKPTRLGSGSVTRPSSAPPRSPLSSSRSHWRLQILFGQLRWPLPSPPWAKHSPPRPLPAPPNGIVVCFLPEEIRVVSPLGICRLRALRCDASPLELAEHAEGAQVLAPRVCSPVEAPDVVLPVHLGEVSPRPRLVGRAGTASPCRPGMHLGAW
jgi:hypothetical protein